MVTNYFKSLLSLIIITSFLGNSVYAQNYPLTPQESITTYLEPIKDNISFGFEPPTKKEKWAQRGEAFVIGTAGFMVGATMLQFMKAEYTRDPMLRAAAIDALADPGGWADLMVFSAASSVSTETLQTLALKHSPQLFQSVTKQMAFTSFLHGTGMTVGSIVMHFFSKYRTSKERADRMAQDREWGYWVDKRNQLLKSKEFEKAETKKQLEVCNERIDHHRKLWKEYAAQSFQKIVDVDSKEAQGLLVSTLQMLITTAIVPIVKLGFNAIVYGGKHATQWAAYKAKVGNSSGLDKYVKSFTVQEENYLKAEIAKAGGQFDKEKLLSKVSKDIMGMRLKNQVRTVMTFNSARIASIVDSLKSTELEKTFAKGRGTLFTRETWKQSVVDKISTSRKALTWSKKASGGLYTAAVSAVIWLGINENATIPLYTKWGYEYSPLGSFGKYIGLYKLEDRITDARINLVDKALKAIKNYKKPSKNTSYVEPDPVTAMNGIPMTIEQAQKDGMPESYAEFLLAAQEFDDVFKTYRTEIVLKDLNEHYSLYVQKIEKIQTEMYRGARYLRWFARGAKMDDIDFTFNGSDKPELVEKYKPQITGDPSSPLYASQIGQPWHKDEAEFAGAFSDEYKEIIKEYKVNEKTTAEQLLKLADSVEKSGNEKLAAETKQFDSFALPMLHKVMPEGRDYANPQVEAGALEKNYELEFDEIKNIVLEMAKQTPPSQGMGALIDAARAANRTKDKPYGTAFFNSEYKNASEELNKLAGELNDEVLAGFEKYNNAQRSHIVALQIHLMMDNIKRTYIKLYKQKAAIMQLNMADIKQVKDFNTENLLDNPYNKKGADNTTDSENDLKL